MRKIREIVRLRLGLGFTQQKTAKSCGVGRTTVGECILRVKAAGLSWPLPEDLDDAQLEELLYPRKLKRSGISAEPDWSKIHLELKCKGVTRQLLWQEYLEQSPDGIGYSQFCDSYREWCHTTKLSMRQTHKAGEKLFVDFAGSTVPIHDPKTGAVKKAEIFVATWGASGYSYVEGVFSQDLPSWISCHVNAFEYFGCVPEIIVPDNLRSAINHACRYDPDINQTYTDFAKHYKCAVIPAHVRKPKHKAKVEFTVLLVTRWILARLRKRRFFSLGELNKAIRELLEQLNAKPFQKMPGSRKSVFEDLDKTAAQALPTTRYIFCEIVQSRVSVDYHVVIDQHFYSVPYQLRGKKVRARLTTTTVEILHNSRRIYTHRRSYQKWGYTTLAEHMPRQHRSYAEWSPERVVEWAKKSGPHVAEMVEKIMAERDHPEQGFRASLGIIRLGEYYGQERLNQACARALNYKVYRFRYIKSILKKGLESCKANLPQLQPIHHENIRGGQYYEKLLEETEC